MDNSCNLNTDCPRAGITAQPESTYSACTMKQQAPESVDGCKFNRFCLLCLASLLLYKLHEMLILRTSRAGRTSHGRDGGQGIRDLCDGFASTPALNSAKEVFRSVATAEMDASFSFERRSPLVFPEWGPTWLFLFLLHRVITLKHISITRLTDKI